jgi:hypothetical protein
MRYPVLMRRLGQTPLRAGKLKVFFCGKDP